MARRSRLLGWLLLLPLLAAVGGLYWYYFTEADFFAPEQINDMLQNKADYVRVKKVELGAHTLRSPYLDKSTLRSPTWDFKGDIIVENGKHVSLTLDKKQQKSNMFAKSPLTAESFEMELTFHIHGGGGLVADGMAIWFLEKPSEIGQVFGAENNFKGYGIFLDTFRNGGIGEFPYVHIQGEPGFNFFNKHSDGLEKLLGGCLAKGLANPYSRKTRLRIIHTQDGYFSLDLNFDPDNSEKWNNCFTLFNVKLPKNAYLGFSAETGELTEHVDLIENKVFALYSPDGKHYIKSIDELETIIQDQLIDQTDATKSQKAEKESIPERVNKRARKSILRLRNSERRIKELEKAHRLEKYGDADATLVRRVVAFMRKFAMYFGYLFGGIFALWIVRLIILSRKSNKYKRRGLLD